MSTTQFGLSLGIDGLGWHPAAERFDTAANPADPRFWRSVIARAEEADFDLVTFEDAPALPADSGQSARLDSFALSSWLGPTTRRIGLVPVGTTALQEPFHVATATQTLDFVTNGRAGLRLRVGLAPEEFAAVGRAAIGTIEELKALSPNEQSERLRTPFAEGWEFAQIVRLLWDSWEDGAEIRDVATGRFLDSERIHNPDFVGEHLAVHGASITPRSPQGQPPVFALAHQQVPYEFAAAAADVAFITPFGEEDLERRFAEARTASDRVRREGTPLQIWADIAVSVGPDARGRLEALDEIAGHPFETDTGTVVASGDELVDLILSYRKTGLDGVRLRPLATNADLDVLAREVLPQLTKAGIATAPEGATLRERLGLPPAPNRFTDSAPFTADFLAAQEATV